MTGTSYLQKFEWSTARSLSQTVCLSNRFDKDRSKKVNTGKSFLLARSFSGKRLAITKLLNPSCDFLRSYGWRITFRFVCSQRWFSMPKMFFKNFWLSSVECFPPRTFREPHYWEQTFEFVPHLISESTSALVFKRLSSHRIGLIPLSPSKSPFSFDQMRDSW